MEQVIIITTEENKKSILRKNSSQHIFYHLKFYTFQDLKKKLFFDYDFHALLFIMNHYHVSLSIAKMYLENLYFLDELDDEKIVFLNHLKKELEEQGLLIFSPTFRSFLKNKRIIVCGYPFLTKEQKRILEQMNCEIEYQKFEEKCYQPLIYEAKNIDEEVEFVVVEIAKLLEKGISIDKIKIIASSDYDNVLNRYLSLFHFPFNRLNNHSFYSTLIAQEFLAHYEEYSLEENLMHLSERYQNVGELIQIINRSAMIQDQKNRKLFIIDDLKKAKVKENVYDQALEIVNEQTSFSDDDYVFWLGFQIGSYPKIKKDTDYLPDSIKEKLGIDTTLDYNFYEREMILQKIHSIQNLIITYKLSGPNGACYPSNLIEEMATFVKPVLLDDSISYSKLYSEIKYAEALDDLYKFNLIGDSLAMYQNCMEIPYMKYDNQFTGLSKNLIMKKLDHELTLSYTNLEMYQECAFRYYISKILRLDIFQESFKTILGSIMHHILELGITKDIDIPVEMMKFVKEKEYVLNAKELFYLEEFSKELTNVLSIIRDQQRHSQLKKYLFENEFFVYKDRDDFNITFKGNIDKVMYEEINGKEVLAVVDYKTGNTNITLKNLDYGLNIQLPIYLYLLKKSDRFQNASIAGFYIQKVLAKKENIQFQKNYQEILKNRLRLQGFTNHDEYLMEMIDDEYQEGKILANVQFKKNGELSSKSKVLTNEEMNEIIFKVDEIIDRVIDSILNAQFMINPKVIEGKNVSCTYCRFRDLCYCQKRDEVVLGGEDFEVDERATVSD